MCWMTETYFRQCRHWGSPILETLCAKGLLGSCGTNTLNGPNYKTGLCAKCRYLQKVQLPRVNITHQLTPGSVPVPLTRESLDEKPLKLTPEDREVWKAIVGAKF